MQTREVDTSGYPGFSIACHNGHIQIANFLVEEGLYEYDDSTFKIACQFGHLEIVKLFLEKGVGRGVRTHGFLRAAQFGHVEIVDLLIKQGVNLKIAGPTGDDAFMISCANGHYKVVKRLIQAGINIEKKSEENGYTGFMRACFDGNFEIVKLLLQHGANVEEQNKIGETGFMICCKSAFNYSKQSGHVEIINLLIEKGARIETNESCLSQRTKFRLKKHVENILKKFEFVSQCFAWDVTISNTIIDYCTIVTKEKLENLLDVLQFERLLFITPANVILNTQKL